MIIDKTITESYFKNHSLDKVRDHWIYHAIAKGENLLCEPDLQDYDHFKDIYQQLLEKVKNFKPYNQKIWVEFFGSQYIPKDIVVYIVIGLKKPYDALALNDKVGNHAIIFDINQINMNDDYVEKFLTHEIAHIIIHRTYPIAYHDLPQEALKYHVFDEGIANFLSYDRDSLSTNWFTEEMNNKRKIAYEEFLDTYHNLISYRNDHCEPYSTLFIALAGTFAIVDFYYDHNKNSNCLKDIVNNGPDCLLDIIKKKKNDL